MEEIILYVNEKLSIIIAYLIIFVEMVGQMFLKKFFNKTKESLHLKVNTASGSLDKAKKEFEEEKAEWQKQREMQEIEKAKLYARIDEQDNEIAKIKKALKRYGKKDVDVSKQDIKKDGV